MFNSGASKKHKVPDNQESTRFDTNNNNVLDQAVGMTKVALDNADYDATIELSTPAIHDFLNNVINLLRMRAAAWAQKGQYDKALQDTTAMMTYAPMDPTGYLCTARRYAEQGFQVRAIDVLKRGLERVPTNDQQYETLCNEKQQAKRRYAHRLDVFAYVPCDVVFRIIEFVPLETITQCTRVSSSWRGYIVNDPKLWQRIDVYSFTGEGVLSPYKLLPSISHHVKELSLPQGKQAKNCTELIKTLDFSNLHSLQVKRTVPSYKLHNHYAQLCSALTNIANTLELLDVYFEGTDDIPHLSDILSICRNLTTIKFTTKVPEAITTSLSLTYLTKLTNIELSTTDRIHSSDLQNLFQHSPHLRSLYIYVCRDDIYDTVEKYCPKLEELSVNGRAWWVRKQHFSFDKVDNKNNNNNSTASPPSSPPATGGLKVLTCHSLESPISIISALEKHHTTLQSLEIRIMFGLQLIEFPHHFAAYPITNLKFFRIDYIPLAVCLQLDTLLKLTPNLQCLHLCHSRHNLIPDNTFKAIAAMPRITEIRLIRCNFNASKLEELLKAYGSNATKSSSLDTLSIKDCAGLRDSILETCAKIQSLSDITISMSEGKMKKESVKTFIQDAASLPHLKQLCIGHTEITEEDLQALSGNPSLSLIHLISIHGVTQTQIKHVIPSNVTVRF
ncbi:hypothetical protein BDC45DRAFT_322869 [Circinella umbellata]|nr:hypothetical protein BDC45DRAFT_322869 [Circinella umbellata]